jgi:hypothetical protein
MTVAIDRQAGSLEGANSAGSAGWFSTTTITATPVATLGKEAVRALHTRAPHEGEERASESTVIVGTIELHYDGWGKQSDHPIDIFMAANDDRYWQAASAWYGSPAEDEAESATEIEVETGLCRPRI